MENVRLIILVSEARAWRSHGVWNQCKPCHHLQWILACALELLPWETLSLGRGPGRVTSVFPGPGTDQSHFVDGFPIPERVYECPGCGQLSSRDHQPASLSATQQLGKYSSFSVLSPTAEVIAESERLKIINKSFLEFLTLVGHISLTKLVLLIYILDYFILLFSYTNKQLHSL